MINQEPANPPQVGQSALTDGLGTECQYSMDKNADLYDSPIPRCGKTVKYLSPRGIPVCGIHRRSIDSNNARHGRKERCIAVPNSAKYADDIKQARLDRHAAQQAPVERAPSLKAHEGTEKCIEVNLSALPKEKRQPVWGWIQTNQPGLAEMLSKDPQFLDIKEAFNCQVKVELPTSVCRQLGLIRC